ncbi:MAG: glucoamylase family protein [Bacteroidota bacterium]
MKNTKPFTLPYFMLVIILAVSNLVCIPACKKKESDKLVLSRVMADTITLSLSSVSKNIPVNSSFIIDFGTAINPVSGSQGIMLKKTDNSAVPCNLTILNNNQSVKISPQTALDNFTQYKIILSSGITGANGEPFPGAEVTFITVVGQLTITGITVNQQDFQKPKNPQNIDYKKFTIQIIFSDSLNVSGYQSCFTIVPSVSLTYTISQDNKTLSIASNTPTKDFAPVYFFISNALTAKNGAKFSGFNNIFYTSLDSTPKFPVIPDEQLLTLIQEKTFRYFYDFAQPDCGMARERNTSGDVVATGGSGFGLMALIVGIERGFITRDQGVARFTKICSFLKTCDRFHGAWPHWLNGRTGKTVPFTPDDDGADLVETSYMVQGLITLRQYLNPSAPLEQSLINRIDSLTNEVEYDWFTRNGQNVLYWHWSPTVGWRMNMQIRGYNETLITYIVAATSTTHPISASVYTQGYAMNGDIRNGSSYYGYTLPLGGPYGGPLFFTQYSYLGLDPRNLQDQYANYMEQNVNQSLINWTYCYTNPRGWVGYSQSCWGLTASDNPWGYDAQSPTNDLGVITPTAAVSAIPFTPEQSMKAIRFFYYTIGDRLWGEYGFRDAFDPTAGWWADTYIAIDQGPIVCMIENYRTGKLWNLFMSSPKVQAGLVKLGFTH